MEFSWKKNLVVLWAGVFFCSMAYSISIPFLPIFMHNELGVGERYLSIWAGVAFGITFLSSALISPFWGSLADKYGRKPMLVRSGFSLAALYFINFFVQSPEQLIALRLFQGLLAGFIPAAIALVGTNTPEDKTGYALGVMSTASASGNIIGPLIGGLVSFTLGNRSAFLFSSAIVLISALVATFLVHEKEFARPKVRSRVKDDLKQAASIPIFFALLGLVAMSNFSVMILEPLITIYVQGMGVSSDRTSLVSGIIFSAVGVATVIMAPRWGRIGGKIGYGKVLIIGLIGGAVGNLLQFFVTGYVGFGILRFVYGLFFAGVFPAVNAMIVQVTKPEFRGRAFSLNQSATQIGTMAGPLIGGVLGAVMPIHWIFVVNGIALLICAFIAHYKKIDQTAPFRRTKVADGESR
ncbi:MFS transporter [Saccharibacillus sp. O23]|uniref:MFS transporter n=1 Tax=Saccharibacillus sp. O23 TaxID=2009338 RepID=UPI0015C5885D|nr:MFS transporter [Saccharibacillus sp. O23]